MKAISSTLVVAAALASALTISGCALTGQTSSVSILAPNVTLPADPAREPVDWSLQIQRPVADQMRDSDRLLVRRGPSRLQVYAGAAWLDNVPAMLQTALVRSFSDAEVLAGVARAGSIRSRYSLATEIRHFEAVETDTGDLDVAIELQAALIHQRSSRPVDSRNFSARRSVAGTDVDPLVAAFEAALIEVFGEMIDWTLASGEAAEARIEERRGDEERRDRRRR